MSDFTGPQRPSGEQAANDPMPDGEHGERPADPVEPAENVDAVPDAASVDRSSTVYIGGSHVLQRAEHYRTEPIVVSGERSAPPGLGVGESPQLVGDERSRATRRIWDAWSGKRSGAVSRPVEVKPPRHPLVVLPMLILLTGVAAFFSWVSAEPLWLYAGHQVSGTVTVEECHAEGFAPRCEGRFVPDAGGDTQPVLRISGDTGAERAGETVTGRVVSPRATSVYIGDELGLLLRWSIGLAVVIAVGFAIAWVAGAWRFTGRLRAGAVGLSLAGPLVIWLGALALTW